MRSSLKKNNVKQEKNGLYCLNDLWRFYGSDPFKRPADWLKLANRNNLIEFMSLNVGSAHIIKTKRGKGSRTWGANPLSLMKTEPLDCIVTIKALSREVSGC